MDLETIKRLLILVGCTSGTYAVYSASKESEIRDDIFVVSGYDPVSRPSVQTHVKIGLSILAIDALDLKGQRLTMAGWISMEWEDPRLIWDKTAKDDIEYIFTKPEEIWKPEVIVDNALADLGVVESDNLLLRVKHTGELELELPLLLTTHCEADITYYPYDEQRCAVELVSWTYTRDEVNFEHLFDTINLEDFEPHGEWEVTRTRIEDKNLTEHMADGSTRIYPQLDFWLYLERRTEFYNLNVMMPIILMSSMVVFVFIVPMDCGEKLAYVLTVFLSLAVLLTIVADTLPRTSITISVLGLYLGIVLILAALGIFLTILILFLFHKEGRPNRRSFIFAFTHKAAKCICWKNHYLKTKQVPGDNQVVPTNDATYVKKKCKMSTSSSTADLKETPIDDFPEDENDDQVPDFEWKDVAMVLDRFCFFVFFGITFLVNFAFVIAFSGLGRKLVE